MTAATDAAQATIAAAPSIVLRMPPGPAVKHAILRVPAGRGRDAVRVLGHTLDPWFGIDPERSGPACSVGITFGGLEALALPGAYQRVFRRLAPAFAAGAVRRSTVVGDSGASAPTHWRAGFAQKQAHVLVSWHGEATAVEAAAGALSAAWTLLDAQHALAWHTKGEQLGAPSGQRGQWVHFGLRDGISEVCIDTAEPPPDAEDVRHHARGALLLGEINDAGFNPFALPRAPAKVRRFFHGGSFGVLRPMQQDLAAFEGAVERWRAELSGPLGPNHATTAFVKAKLCGRWPDGRVLSPHDVKPKDGFKLDLADDGQGHGCPFGSHVRRMRAAPDGNGFAFERPLQRRSVPFGPAAWEAAPDDGIERGLLGHFFCASIEQQFEHLLGQWAARPPLGFGADDDASDPLIGPQRGTAARLAIPLPGRTTEYLGGLHDWVTTQGTLYAWYPSRNAWQSLLDDDFVPDENEVDWVDA
jgi:deferrochelatase/peroxidase EfeB